MSFTPQVILGSASIVAAFGVAFWAVSGGREESIGLTSGSARPDQRHLLLTKSARERAVQPLMERIGARLRRFLPAHRVRTLERKLQQAGQQSWTIERMMALKVTLTLLFGLTIGLLLVAKPSVQGFFLFVAAATLGWFTPNALLEGRVDDRKQAIRREVSDTIDQLGVMVRAGLGIDAAISRISTHGQGPLAAEFAHVMQDMRFGIDRHTALSNMAERVDVPELRGFAAALAQADALGLPISDTLLIQSEELRDKATKAAEEQAMKLPVKLLFPMVVCILPVLFIAIIGPAAINIFDTLGS